jgi:signal transduction histidine kinase
MLGSATRRLPCGWQPGYGRHCVPPDAADRGRAEGTAGPRPAGQVIGTAIAGALLCGLAVAIAASRASSEYAAFEATVRGLIVGAPIAVGLYAWRTPRFERFGTLLIAVGAVAFLATLSESPSPELYSVARVSAWLLEPLLFYVVLAFPSGRLRTRVDRALVGSGVLLVVVLYLPTALLVERYPEPFPWSRCHGGCPGNAFVVASSEPAFVEDVVRPLREVLGVLLIGVVTARVGLRLRRASHLMRRALSPVLGAAVLRLATFAGGLGLRGAAPDSDPLAYVAWLLALGVPLLAGAFLLGLVRWRLFVASGIQRLALGLGGHPRPEGLRAALAEAYDDSSLEILYRLGDGTGWADAQGRPVDVPPEGAGRWVTEVRDGDDLIAAIVHDEALRDEPAFIEAATAYAVMTIDNRRLGAKAAALLAEVQESRARIQVAADDERRRIERDLHDGAQQRLVALRIKLELAAERIDGADHGSAELIRQLGVEVEAALDEVRSLARGIYPSPLADRGLVEGLRSAALQAALPTTVIATGVSDRYPSEIESAAYFCCLEALQNAAKHARDATVVLIDITDDGVLRFEVRDDGAGFDAAAARPGMGLTSMHDRLAAVGGQLAIVSSPGHGTRVIGRIPTDDRGRLAVDGRRSRRAVRR